MSIISAFFHFVYAFFRNRVILAAENLALRQQLAILQRQLVESFLFDTAPKYLIRDRDSIYRQIVEDCLENLGIEEVITAPRSSWQNLFVERLIGTVRRELLDHVIMLNEKHLMQLLADFFGYYHASRCHRSLNGNSPGPRQIEPPEEWPGRIYPDGQRSSSSLGVTCQARGSALGIPVHASEFDAVQPPPTHCLLTTFRGKSATNSVQGVTCACTAKLDHGQLPRSTVHDCRKKRTQKSNLLPT